MLFQKVEQVFLRQLQVFSFLFAFHCGVLLQLADAQRYHEAIPVFRRATRTNVRYAAWNNLGVSLSRSGQLRGALRAYGSALRYWRNAPVVRFNRGVAHLKLRDAQSAERDFRAGTQAQADFPACWNNLGVAQLRQRRYKSALTSLRQALRHLWHYPAAWNNLGAAYWYLGKERAARAAFQRALKLRPGYGPARRNLALLEHADLSRRPVLAMSESAKKRRLRLSRPR